MSLNEITGCEVCGATGLTPALDLGPHPMCDDLVAVGDSRVCKEYPIEILLCDNCITAHQRFQIPKRDLFPSTYHYRSRHTADVLNGMRQLVEAVEQTLGTLKGRKVLDIGCNDGSLLSIFQEKGAETFGIEPTGAAEDAKQHGHKVLNDFFSESVAQDFVKQYGRPDVISFTNVFAHIEDLHAVIRALKILAHAQTMIVVENHYFGAVLEKRQFDTFYHEHPRTYSYTSFAHIADSLGMKIKKVEFPKRYGGNIRVFMANSATGTHDRFEEMSQAEKTFGSRLMRLGEEIETWKQNKRAVLSREVARHGKLVAKAFPGRSAISVKLLGLDESMISAVYEKPASGKIGHYVPGTRIPIKSDAEMPKDADPILNLAWHISAEIGTYLKAQGYNGRIIDILSEEDFSSANALAEAG
jgi:SAM-dependent methyltransferase